MDLTGNASAIQMRKSIKKKRKDPQQWKVFIFNQNSLLFIFQDSVYFAAGYHWASCSTEMQCNC